MKSKLLSLSRNDVLYLPMLKINDEGFGVLNSTENAYIVASDANTVGTSPAGGNLSTIGPAGVLDGVTNYSPYYVEIDQGLDTTEISIDQALSSDLVETQFLIEIDNRLGAISVIGSDRTATTISFIDDDNIAYYYLTTSDTDYISDLLSTDQSALAGPRGKRLQFKINASIDLQSGTSLFTRLGATVTGVASDSTTSYHVINSIIRVSGVTTGYRLDVPVKFIRKV